MRPREMSSPEFRPVTPPASKIFFKEKTSQPKAHVETRQVKDFFTEPAEKRELDEMFEVYAKAILAAREQHRNSTTFYNPIGFAAVQNFLIQKYLSQRSEYNTVEANKMYKDFHRRFHESQIFKLVVLPQFDAHEEFSENGIDQVINYISRRSGEQLPAGQFRHFGFNNYLDAHHGIDVVEMIASQSDDQLVVKECNLVQVKAHVDDNIFKQYVKKHTAYVHDYLLGEKELQQYYWEGKTEAFGEFMDNYKSNFEDALLELAESFEIRQPLSPAAVLKKHLGLSSKQQAPLVMMVRNPAFRKQYQMLRDTLDRIMPNEIKLLDDTIHSLDHNFNKIAEIQSCSSQLWNNGKLYKSQKLYGASYQDRKAIEYKS